MADYFAADATYMSRTIDNLLAAFPDLLEDEELRTDTIEGETDLPSMMSRLVRARAERMAHAEGLNEYIKDLTGRRDRLSKGADALKSIMLKLMATAQIPKLPLPEATVSVSAGRSTVSITDINALPQGTFALVRQPDKDALKALLEAGEDVPGAALVIGENVLTVRQK